MIQSTNMEQKKVLVIEDEPDIREAIVEALSETNIITYSAENGQQGLRVALEEKPDMILLDLVMPIMDGHEFLKQLRLDPWGRSAKVITLTSMDDVNSIASAHKGDIEDYIIKSHNSLKEILSKVRLSLYSD